MLLWRENGNLPRVINQRETNPLWCRHTTHIHDGLLESCQVVVHVVAAAAEEAHEDEHEVSMHLSPRVTQEERLQEVHLLRFQRHWMQQKSCVVSSDALSLLETRTQVIILYLHTMCSTMATDKDTFNYPINTHYCTPVTGTFRVWPIWLMANQSLA